MCTAPLVPCELRPPAALEPLPELVCSTAPAPDQPFAEQNRTLCNVWSARGDTPGPVHMSVEVLVLEPSYAVCSPPSPADLETHTSAFASRRARTTDDRNAAEVSPLPAFGRSLPRLSLYSKIHCKIFTLEVVYLCFLSIFFLGSPEITRNN